MEKQLNPVVKGALKVALGGVCAYELTALTGLPWPTITTVVHQHRDSSKLCRVSVWASLGVVAWHLLVEKSQSHS